MLSRQWPQTTEATKSCEFGKFKTEFKFYELKNNNNIACIKCLSFSTCILMFLENKKDHLVS